MDTTSRPRRRARGLLIGLAAASALALGSLAAAVPASAATTVTLSGVGATGTVGVNQYLTVTVNTGAPCGSVLAPTVTMYGVVNNATQTLGTATFQTCSGTTNQYLYPWAPNQAQVWYVYAQSDDGTQSTYSRSAINTGPTSTVISAPSTVKLGQPVTLTATVSAANGAVFSPQGTVQFSIVGGANIGGPVTLNTSIPSTASVQWTPAVLGSTALIATYTPINAGTPTANSNCGSSCTSAPDVVQVTDTGVNVYLTNPPSFAAGVASPITAIVSVVPPSGSVTFTVNGGIIAANVPVQSSGQATTNWTPPAAGNYTIAASWTGNGGLTGTSQETVAVGPTPAQADQIIVTTSAGTTLVPGSTYDVPNGTQLTFSSSTASGSALTFTEAGPCSLTTNTFAANQGNGQCRVTATSPGGNGYGPATATVTLNLVPGTQSATLAAPASGKVNVGRTLTLQKASQGETSAGQTISWKITKGKGSVCSLSFPSSGAVKLKIKAKGTCTVQASAKAVSGQWNKYLQTWTYKGV